MADVVCWLFDFGVLPEEAGVLLQATAVRANKTTKAPKPFFIFILNVPFSKKLKPTY